MALTLQAPPLAEKDTKSDYVAVKILASVHKLAKQIAAHRDCTIADYLSSVLSGPVKEDFEKMVKDLTKSQGNR